MRWPEGEQEGVEEWAERAVLGRKGRNLKGKEEVSLIQMLQSDRIIHWLSRACKAFGDKWSKSYWTVRKNKKEVIPIKSLCSKNCDYLFIRIRIDPWGGLSVKKKKRKFKNWDSVVTDLCLKLWLMSYLMLLFKKASWFYKAKTKTLDNVHHNKVFQSG